MGNRFHQQKLTVAYSIDRKTRWKDKFYDYTDVKFFYKISDERIMMAVRYGSGKNRNKLECVFYNVFKKEGIFVIMDPEPTDAPIWFENQILFDKFIAENCLSSAEFATCKTSKMVPTIYLDDAIPTLWEDFRDLRKGTRRQGDLTVEFINVLNSKKFKINGVINRGQTWKDYFEWIIGSIEDMDEVKLSNIRILSVYYDKVDDKITTLAG